MTRADTLTRALSLVLANSMQRHGHTCESLARWISDDDGTVSATVIKRYRNTSDPRTITGERIMKLPPAIRRDVVAYLADIDNCITVERVDMHADGETLRERADDAVIAASAFLQHTRTGRGDGARLHDDLTRTVARARPGLRRSRPAPPMASPSSDSWEAA